MAEIQPVPQWALPFLGDQETMEKLGLKFNPVWLKWFIDLIDDITTGGAVDHNTLSGLQGGTAGQYYHLTAAQHTAFTTPGAAGTFLRSNGTDWAASTLTLPNTLTSGQVLYGTATNAVGGSANLTFNGTTNLLVGNGTSSTIQLAGATSSFPMLKRTNAVLDMRLADDSAFTTFRAASGSLNGFSIYTTQALTTLIGSLAADVNGINVRTTATSGDFTIGMSSTSNTTGRALIQTAGINQFRIGPTGRISIGGNANAGAGTAWLHLPASTTAANTAPLKFTSGTLMTTAEAGGVEFLTDDFYATITTGAARKPVVLADAALTSGRVSYNTTNGRQTDNSGFTFNGTTLTAPSLVGSAVNGHAFGIAADALRQITVGGTYAGRSAISIESRLQPAVGANGNGLVITPTLDIAGSGTHSLFDTLALNQPTLTAGAGTVTNATTLRVTNAPTGATNNRALWVQAGLSQFDGNVRFGTHSAIGAETLTGFITITDSGGTTRKLGVIS